MSSATAPHPQDQSLPRMLSSDRASDCAPAVADLRFRLRHGARGFVAGLVVVVPAVLWVSGRLDGSAQPMARVPAVVIAPVSVKPIEVPKATASIAAAAPAPLAAAVGAAPPALVAAPPPTRSDLTAPAALPRVEAALPRVEPAAEPARPEPAVAAAGLPDGAPTPTVNPVSAQATALVSAPADVSGPPPATASPAEEIAGRLEAARALVVDGDVLAARAVLAEAALASVPEAAYVIAETYDPNVLAALGITDVRAEVELARLFYERALTGGIGAARQRLEGLR